MMGSTEPEQNAIGSRRHDILSSFREMVGRPSALLLLALAASGCGDSTQDFNKRAILIDSAGRQYSVYVIRSHERKSICIHYAPMVHVIHSHEGINMDFSYAPSSYIDAFGRADADFSAATFYEIHTMLDDKEDPLKQYASLAKLEEIYNQVSIGQIPQHETTRKDGH